MKSRTAGKAANLGGFGGIGAKPEFGEITTHLNAHAFQGAVELESLPTIRRSALRQLRVFGLGLFQERDAGVGVFPEGKEVLVGGFCSCGIAGQCVRAADLKISQ